MRYTVVLLMVVLGSRVAGATELPGRYTFEKVPEGYLRLDTVTGSVSLCAPENGLWRCDSVNDAEVALRAQNDRLRARVHELEGSRFALPLADQDVDRLLNWFAELAGRFVDFAARMDRLSL